MAKKVKKAVGGVMEQLQAYQPPWNDPEETEDNKGKETDQQVKSLTEQLAQMQAKIDGFQRQDAYRSFQSAPAVTAPVQTVTGGAKKGLDLKGLPDPVSETDKWQGELEKRVVDFVQSEKAQLQAETAVMHEQAALATNLWGGFQKAHPDWADHELLVEAAAGRVSQGLQAKGVNVVQLMKQQPELFYSEVAGMLEKQYPQLKGKASEEVDEEVDDESKPAVAEVFGGQAGGRGGSLAADAAAAGSTEDANRAWMRELGEQRHKIGLR